MECLTKPFTEQRDTTARSKQLLIEAEQAYTNSYSKLKPLAEKAEWFVQKQQEGEQSIRFHYKNLKKDAIATLDAEMDAALLQNREENSAPDDLRTDLDNTTSFVQTKECHCKYLKVWISMVNYALTLFYFLF